MTDTSGTIAVQFARQIECAHQAGIYDAMFLAFGSLLGHVREGGVISHDHDVDVGILRHLITPEQEKEYHRLLQQPCAQFPQQHKGVGQFRNDFALRPDDGRYFWLSVRAGPQEQCRSCCHWFFFEHAGYSWHCKHKTWKPKGMPLHYAVIGREIEFLGSYIHTLRFSGACLDWWYPNNWLVPQQSGASSRPVSLIVKDWRDKKTWKVAA